MADDRRSPGEDGGGEDNPLIPVQRVFIDRRQAQKPAEECVAFLRIIGIDANSLADQDKLREALRWAAEAQQREQKAEADRALDRREKRTRNYVFVYGVAASAASILLTALYTHFFGGHG